MDTVKILRLDKGDQGVFGKIIYKSFTRFTGELPDKDNVIGLSCIPTGLYEVYWARSNRLKKNTYRFRDVKGRTGVLIHSANLMGDKLKGYIAQLEGCVALGEYIGYINKQKAILVSRPAVSAFEALMQYKPFMLEIKNA